jgi:hypothetical protein
MSLDELLDITYREKYLDQGSEQWENIRAGRFTSSEWWKLMECGKRLMTPEELAARPKTGKGSKTTQVPDPSLMSERGITYIRQKVSEVLTGKPKPSAYAYPLIYGKETEPDAVEYFEKVTGLICEETGFHPYTDHAGGSPDRLIGEKEGLEIKCPFQSENQVDYLMLTDFYDLKSLYPEYYWQCVTLLKFTGRELWHFVTYDPRMINDVHKMTHIQIPADKVKEDIDLIDMVLTSAVKEKLSLLNTLKANENH